MNRTSITLLFILTPFLLYAQSTHPVEPVISNDYLKLIASPGRQHDSSYSMRKSPLVIDSYFYPSMPVKKIRVVDGKLKITRNDAYRLALGGSLNAALEYKTINRLPALQEQYVQGRSVNGELVYRGPETNELLSYGPSLQPGAPAYHHPVFRTARLFSQAFNLQADLLKNNLLAWNFDLKLGQSKEQTFIRENENSSKSMAFTLGAMIKGMKISGSYNYLHTRFTNSNRNGFLNRVYQNALLTPVSFGDPYTSYSSLADNPNFLLRNSGNNYFQTQQNTGLIISKWHQKYEYKLTQSYENIQENSLEGYKPGTAYFPAGITFQRNKHDANYFLHANGLYRISHSSRLNSEIKGNYTLRDLRSAINTYHYQRTAQQATLSFATRYNTYDIETGIDAGNRIYLSNTLINHQYFSPSANIYAQLKGHLKLRANASYNQYYSELPVSQSLSYANLFQYSSAQAMQYFPLKEVNGYDKMRPVTNREWTGVLSLTFKHLFISGEVFLRDVQDEMFPVYENNAIVLKNIADHRKTGIDLSLQLFETGIFNRRFSTTNRLSFYAYNDKVTQVADGYNFSPIAGFSNVRKALVKGEVLGAIVGNTYERDANQQLIIGPDGFPLVNDRLSVIGNPIPDLVIKMSHDLHWKQLTFGIDWEWKKGGDVWNGTQAALDYYGRSDANRHVKGYVFPGVTTDGHVNTMPVDFYNPALPVEQNRWVRYGESGVAEAYIQKGDHLRINNLQLSWHLHFKHIKSPQKITLSTYISNLLLWTAYKGVDPNQVLYDQTNAGGLDFFNLPATKTYGFNVSLQF
ncbi:TonB-dependent receptor [Chitinophaga niabensis]|uniref:TonB-linked outer membrane protein, SusC/RagA family n=1 Tax=Chitinophaga niabensis TaxID=536979 RepID=A0A1N6D5Y1_9BACT|nr:TonB-dependent receptor [Chitinophaga niabensis]SIN66117.1 hypothetical protein SAMN04488055_0315 [Chitinophaga niabensis]